MVISLELLLRTIAVLLFVFRQWYWFISEREAELKIPKAQSPVQQSIFRMFALRLFGVILLLQLLGMPLLQINATTPVLFFLQVVGFLLIVVGIGISINARKTIGANWSHAFEYQVKQKQELIQGGIYRYIRHPIYAGLMLSFIGGELLAQSYVVFALSLLIIGGYNQAKSEEKLLTSHFGEKYKTYMKHSKMFIPFLW